MLCANGAPDPDGIESAVETLFGFRAECIRVTTPAGAEKLGKPVGTYFTVDTGKVWRYDSERFFAACDAVCACLLRLVPKTGSCLLVGLGNRSITADATGPLTAEHFIVTRHIKQNDRSLFETLGLRETMCIVPNVLGNTGLEASDTVRGITERARPACVIAVDSLASRRTSRLATTVQLCDTGISPGAGVGNRRQELSQRVLGVPVIAVGVPTVVDAATIGADILEEYLSRTGAASGADEDSVLRRVLPEESAHYFVTPRDADVILRETARLIAYAVNKALSPSLAYADMPELLAK